MFKGTLFATLDQAERLFHETVYIDACPLYEELLQTTPEPQPAIHLRLATCYLQLKEDQKAIDTLHPASLFTHQFEKERNALLAFAYRQTGQYLLALELLPEDSAHLERGLNHFYLNHDADAQAELQSVNDENSHDFFLAQLYLARLELKAQKWSAAQLILDKLEQRIPSSDPLRIELTYLQGFTAYHVQDYSRAIHYFELSDQALDTLYYLGLSYLKEGLFSKSEAILQKALSQTKEERFYLALANLYISQFYFLKDPQAAQKAKEILSRSELAGQEQTLLLLPMTGSSYLERDQLYDQLITSYPSFSLAWYYKGMNAFEESDFNSAAQAFAHAYSLLKEEDLAKAMVARRTQALALFHQNKIEEAWIILKELAQQENSAEVFYLAALAGSSLTNLPLQEIILFLEKGIELEPTSKWGELCLKQKGTLEFQLGHFDDADKTFAQLIDGYPSSSFKNEAWFWRAKCAEKMGEDERMRELLREIYEKEPKSPEAPRAYLSCYPYRDYMQGQRKAIKHLQAMPTLFHDHPLLILASYLIGLDHKKDHLSPEGKVQYHQNLIAAIEAFLKAENLFDDLEQRHLIANDEIAYFSQLRDRAHLERALANIAIAEQSQGAKKQIFLEYSEEVLQQLKDRLSEKASQETVEETDYYLADVDQKLGKHKKADELYDQMLNRYRQANIHKGYILSQVWTEKGKRAQQEKDYAQALACFKQAEATAWGLSPDQKLEIWLQQSLCQRELGHFDEAMWILSQVVNDEAISGLRVKAMFLRAEIYAQQGKPELALKQLEATSKKGGEWGQKAQEKLKREYKYE